GPAPTSAAGAAPAPGVGAGGGGRGGSGGGSGSGSGSGTGSGVASVTPSPSPSPTPVPAVLSGLTRIRGRVVDASTFRGVPGVCLVPGSLDCDAHRPHSDANGYWYIDVKTGAYWEILLQQDYTRLKLYGYIVC